MQFLHLRVLSTNLPQCTLVSSLNFTRSSTHLLCANAAAAALVGMRIFLLLSPSRILPKRSTEGGAVRALRTRDSCCLALLGSEAITFYYDLTLTGGMSTSIAHTGYDRLEEPPSYSAFLQNYLLPNKPVLIGPALVSSWSACSDWVRPDGLIDWTYLQAEYGHLTVTVADCSTREFSDQRREQVPFRDVVSLWEEGKGQNLYVKDWHLARALASTPSQLRTYSAFYTTPDIFRDDWMNAYYSAHTEDDFRFVYVGAAGTFTPLHRDVYTSYSWSTNVCGRKRWWLFPPEHTNFLLRKGGEEHLETAYDVRQVDPELYPNFSQAQPLIIEQESGQTIFVPSGWYHQVENLTDCISINHNWCNAVNLPSLYESMCAKVTEVEHALEDVQEMLSQGAENSPNPDGWQSDWIAIVQDVVEKDAGWNWATFWRMVRHALCLAMGRPCPVKADLWPPTPHDLMPRLDFITTRVEACYADFIKRPQREIDLVTGLKEVLSDIHGLLHG